MERITDECEGCSRDAIDLCYLRQGLAYRVCGCCGHCLIEVPSQTEDQFETAQELYFGHGSVLLQAGPGLMDREILSARLEVISSKLTPHSRVLEVGPGAGYLSKALMERGYEVKAIEHSAVLAQALRERYGLDVNTGAFETGVNQEISFDAFCSFHVIEHVPDPLQHLQTGFDSVQPGGLGFVATPNARSWQQRFFPRLSPNFDQAHLRVFSRHSLQVLCEKAGWEVIDIHTPEYSSAWLRVLSKGLRRLKREDEVETAGKYAAATGSGFEGVYRLFGLLTVPVRYIQRLMKGGNELFFVLRKPARHARREATGTRIPAKKWSST